MLNIIQLIWVIDDNAIIFFILVWFKAIIDPIKAFIPNRIKSNLSYLVINILIINIGKIFWVVIINLITL